MIPKPLASIGPDDIRALVGTTQERGDLEYKEKLPGAGPGDGPEFVADITSFANTRDGDLVFGMREKKTSDKKPTGIAESIVGLAGNLDSEVLRLDSILRDGATPRLSGVEMQIVRTSPLPVLLVRVRRSWAGPHMVKASGRFFGRNNAGKFPLDVDQIRAGFLRTSTLTERLQSFRADRLLQVRGGSVPVPIPDKRLLVLHVFPFTMFDSGRAVDVASVFASPSDFLASYQGGAVHRRMNLEGCVAFSGRQPPFRAYALLFRTGAVEWVHGEIIANGDEYPYFSPSGLEPRVVDHLKRYLHGLVDLGVAAPFAVGLSLLGIRHLRGVPKIDYDDLEVQGADRDDLVLPEIIIEEPGANLEGQLRPLFDSLWQSVGRVGSPNYDESGAWRPVP